MGLSQARHRDQTAGYVDVIGDIIESANIVIRKPSTATIVLGGGTPKNFINQASVQAEFYDDRVGGHKYAIQIVTDVPHFGGASGSSLEEAQSWGKLSIESEKVTVHADVTLALPLLVTRARNDGRRTRRRAGKRPEFDPSGRVMVDERPAARRQPLPGVLMPVVRVRTAAAVSVRRRAADAAARRASARRDSAGAVRPHDVVRVGHAATARGSCLIASAQVELWDEELGVDVHERGMFTLPEMDLSSVTIDRARSPSCDATAGAILDHEQVPGHARRRALDHLAARRGRGRATPRPRASCRSTRTPTCATATCRERHSHACAMRRTLEHAPLVQVGIRNISEEEVQALPAPQDDDLLRLEHARRSGLDRARGGRAARARSTSRSTSTGSIPATMPAVGTPEPGGLSWRELTALLRRTFERKTVVACDVVELCPVPGLAVAELHRGEARLQATDLQVWTESNRLKTCRKSSTRRGGGDGGRGDYEGRGSGCAPRRFKMLLIVLDD